ncbi:MAG: YlqD family protein [Microcoleaceae cyanobacterium]
MDISDNKLLLKRMITVKAIVTPRFKEEFQQQLQGQINQADSQLQQLEMQGQRMISEIKRQSIQPPSMEVQQQIENIQIQVNEQKSKLLEQKNQNLQQLQQVQTFELEQEVSQGQIESIFAIDKGDNLIQKMQVELVLRDGVIEDIRGEL